MVDLILGLMLLAVLFGIFAAGFWVGITYLTAEAAFGALSGWIRGLFKGASK